MVVARKNKTEQIGYKPSQGIALSRMKAVVDNLNWDTFPEVKAELRRLVTDWFDSGPNLRKMLGKEPELHRRGTQGRTDLIPTETGAGVLLWRPEILDEDVASHKDLALTHFMNLIANPRWELLGGPCARCGKYYLKKTKRQKAYCSRACGAAATAVPATDKRRQQEQARKVNRAQKAIAEWIKSPTKLGWKPWVAAETGYNIRWVTQAETRGQLQPPVKPLKVRYRNRG
jgi:hypothetical protein